MAITPPPEDEHEVSDEYPDFYAIIDYEDDYVQPLILSALASRLGHSAFKLTPSTSALARPETDVLQFRQYESIEFEHAIANPTTSLINAYVIRKALIRKHYLSTTIAHWIVKNPDSVLKKHVKPSVDFELDFAEFLDEALVEAWELKESWEKNEGKKPEEREWWILKPGMSERGQGIRLFSSEDELQAIFEEWEVESSVGDEEDEVEEEDEDVRSDEEPGVASLLPRPLAETLNLSSANKPMEPDPEEKEAPKQQKDYIITSHLRHFIAQPYIHPPLLLPHGPSPSSPKKFHIRTYVVAVGSLRVYVYKLMLALFAARPYIPPWESVNSEEGLRAHLTNTCLQETGEREGSVGLFWELGDELPEGSGTSFTPTQGASNWKEAVYSQISAITSEVFEAAARGMSIHFQTLPNAFEIFGVDFMVGVDEGTGELTTYLLEINAFPDFRQTGEELKGLVGGLFEEVVDVAVGKFFGFAREESGRMDCVLDLDLGRR